MLMKVSKVSNNVKLPVDAELLVSEAYARDELVSQVICHIFRFTHKQRLSPQQEGCPTNDF
jgi:hypothetical protein